MECLKAFALRLYAQRKDICWSLTLFTKRRYEGFVRRDISTLRVRCKYKVFWSSEGETVSPTGDEIY